MHLNPLLRTPSGLPAVEVCREIDVESGPDLQDRLLSIMHTHGSRLARDLFGVTFHWLRRRERAAGSAKAGPSWRPMAAPDRSIPVHAAGHGDHGNAG